MTAASTAERITVADAAAEIWKLADRPWSTVAYDRIQIRDALMLVVEWVQVGNLEEAREQLALLGRSRFAESAQSAVEQIGAIIDRTAV